MLLSFWALQSADFLNCIATLSTLINDKTKRHHSLKSLWRYCIENDVCFMHTQYTLCQNNGTMKIYQVWFIWLILELVFNGLEYYKAGINWTATYKIYVATMHHLVVYVIIILWLSILNMSLHDHIFSQQFHIWLCMFLV